MAETSAPAKLARMAVEAYVREGKVIDPPEGLPDELLDTRAGAFVCLKIDGQLRGCMGTIEPTQPDVAREIIHNAISAATRDPRFDRVHSRELDEIRYSVDILSPAERVSSADDLDPKRYGVIVESGSRRGLLLPDLEGVDTAEDQISIACRKAGIVFGDPVTLYRFEVVRYD